MDIYAVPAKGQKIPSDSCLQGNKNNVKDLERDLENTYAFLDKRFGIKKKDVERRWKA
jgi:fructose-specific component phosphotransferase system IIB-like protein